MPTFQWSGRDKKGNLVSGNIDARSEDEALGRLRQQSISLTSIRRIAAHSPSGFAPPRSESRLRRVLPRILLAAALLIGSYFTFSISVGTIIHCESIVRGNAYRCTVEESTAGQISGSSQQISNADRALAEEETETQKTRIAIQSNEGNIATPWMSHPFPSSKKIADQLNAQLDNRFDTSLRFRQFELPPAACAAVLLISGLALLISAAGKMIRS